MRARIAVFCACLVASVMAADGAYFGLAPERSAWGIGEIVVRLDLPEAIEGWGYGLCIRECARARFLSARVVGVLPGDPDLGTLIVEDCSIVRARAIDPLTSGTLGPVSAYADIAVKFEAWEPTEIAVCESAGVRGSPVVVVVAGASTPASGGTAHAGLSPLEDFTCTPEPLECDAWKVEMRWDRTGAVDVVRFYKDGALLAEGPGNSYGGAYRGGAGTVELAVEPVFGTHVGERLTCVVTIPSSRTGFIRGDANQDARVDIADAVMILQHLFGGSFLLYAAAADVNADGATNIADPIYLLAYLFGQGASPPAPFPECGTTR